MNSPLRFVLNLFYVGVLILSPKASHIPHRIMRLSSWTTFSYNTAVRICIIGLLL